MNTRRIALSLIVPIAAFAAIGLGPPASAAPTCKASVHGELSHVEPKELVTTQTFTVDVATLEPCANIRFAVYTTERISKTRVKVVETPDEVRLRNGSIERILNYDLPNDREIVKWEVKVIGCERCEP